MLEKLGGKRKAGGRVVRKRVKQVPIFLLVRQIRLNPMMKFYESWDQLEGDRAKRLDKAMDKVVAELEDGK